MVRRLRVRRSRGPENFSLAMIVHRLRPFLATNRRPPLERLRHIRRETLIPVSKLLLAPTPLVGCVFAAVWRDTRGVDLSDADRVSHFPASPLVSLTLVIHGELQVAAGDAPRCDVW